MTMQGIKELYEIRFSEADRANKKAIWRVLCESFFCRYVKSTDTVLDIACGYGEFSNYIEAGQKIAIDLNPDAKKFLKDDVEFHLSSASAMNEIPSLSVDVCFSSNFFEHLADRETMDGVLHEAFRVLKPNGRYVAMQPNIRYEPGRYWDYYDHVLPLSHLSCKEAFEKAGYCVEELIPKFIPFSTASRLPQWPILVKLYLAFPPIWRFLGGQFLIVARKPI
jgi:ubiquinone/menaquinone biosynthesis C-methylase UbiE